MFFLPLLIGAGLAYVFLKRPTASSGASTGAYGDDYYGNDNGGYAALPPGPDAYAYPLLSESSSAPPPWPTQAQDQTSASLFAARGSLVAPFDAAAYSALAAAASAPQGAQNLMSAPQASQKLGTLYAAQDKTPIRAEPGVSQDQRGTFTVYAGYPMTVLSIDPSGWVHVELEHPQHGTVDGYTEFRLLTAIAPPGSLSVRATSGQPSSAAAQTKGGGGSGTVPIFDATTGAIVGHRPRFASKPKPDKRRGAARAATGG